MQAEERTIEAQEKVDDLKGLVGAKPDPAEPSVKMIMEDFKKDQSIYGETYEKNKLGGVKAKPTDEDIDSSTYPLMLRYLIDANEELYGLVEQKDKHFVEVEKNHSAEKEKLIAEKAEIQIQLNDMSGRMQEIQVKFSEDRKKHEQNLNVANEKLRKAEIKIADVTDKARREKKAFIEASDEQAQKLSTTTAKLNDSRKIDLEAPDGEVVWVNQVDGTVYVDIGRYDGLRRQTTFSVYPRDVSNALNAEPKGTIEIVRVDDHMSVAKVTSDPLSNEHLLNPILKGDKVISTTFYRGQPEHFAIAGEIDIDGNGQSDLSLLLQLIERNGGIVDKYVDDEGNIRGDGKISPRTKYLVIGKKPTHEGDNGFLESYQELRKKSSENGVRIITLKDLLDLMGYEGQGRSVGLGRTAKPDDFKDERTLRRPPNDFNESQRFRRAEPNFNEGQQFRRRPAS